MVELPEELANRPARQPGQAPTATLTLDAYPRSRQSWPSSPRPAESRSPRRSASPASMGDLKENAEYHAAKDEQGLMESKIRKLQHMLGDPEIVEAPAAGDEVGRRHARHDPPARRGRPRRRDVPARRERRGEGRGRSDGDHHLAARASRSWARPRARRCSTRRRAGASGTRWSRSSPTPGERVCDGPS